MCAFYPELFQAVLDTPLDDAPRLVYADWLEEQGDPRAELIRLQISLVRQPQHPQRFVWKARVRELVELHHAEFIPPSRKGVTWGPLERGWVGEVQISKFQSLKSMEEELFTLTPVYRLTLTHFPLKELKAFVRWNPLRRLHTLNMWLLSMQNDHVKTLLSSSLLGGLHSLSLTGNELTNQGLMELAQSKNLPQLHDLSIGYNSIDDAGLLALIQSPYYPRLQTVYLWGLQVSEAVRQALLARFAKVHF